MATTRGALGVYDERADLGEEVRLLVQELGERALDGRIEPHKGVVLSYSLHLLDERAVRIFRRRPRLLMGNKEMPVSAPATTWQVSQVTHRAMPYELDECQLFERF